MIRGPPIRGSHFLRFSQCWLRRAPSLHTPGDPQQLARPQPARVILIRGWQDLYSEGIDQLSSEIAQHGIATEVFRANQWEEVADKLLHSANPGPVTLIGFSYGADDVILVSRKLHDEHRPVDLLITIDPVTPKPVPDTVRRCFNYYQSNGVWDALPWLRGVPLEPDLPRTSRTRTLQDRSEKTCCQPDTSHATINKLGNPLLHREIMRRVLESTGQQK